MPYADTSRSSPKVEGLMEIASTLADFTASLDLCGQIPAYLSHALHIEPLTLAIVQHESNLDPRLLVLASSGQVAVGEAAVNFHNYILDLYHQTRPLNAHEAPALRHAGDSSDGFAEMTVQNLVTFPRASIFAKNIDESHRLLLIVHQRAGNIHLGEGHTDTLLLIASHLGKLLRTNLAWQRAPELLGDPFARLTEREWVVLRALDSDEGEKQLADRLRLSPHTLHSHIKAIYRKVGAQGRLPLLLRLQRSVRDLRKAKLSGRVAAPAVQPMTSAIAVG